MSWAVVRISKLGRTASFSFATFVAFAFTALVVFGSFAVEDAAGVVLLTSFAAFVFAGCLPFPRADCVACVAEVLACVGATGSVS